MAQDSSLADGRPGLRMATPAFNRAWRTVPGYTWSSLPIEAQERPEAQDEIARSMWSGVSTRPRLDTRLAFEKGQDAGPMNRVPRMTFPEPTRW